MEKKPEDITPLETTKNLNAGMWDVYVKAKIEPRAGEIPEGQPKAILDIGDEFDLFEIEGEDHIYDGTQGVDMEPNSVRIHAEFRREEDKDCPIPYP